MEAKASKHASKCEHACARVRACVCVRERVRARSHGGGNTGYAFLGKSVPGLPSLPRLGLCESAYISLSLGSLDTALAFL